MDQSTEPTTIYIIDDEAIIRAGYRALLGRIAGFEVVGDNASARRAIAEIEVMRPDIVFLDITMADLSGIDAIALIKRAAPDTRILMASTHEGTSFVQQSLRAGADGYISKDSDPEELRLAVTALCQGEAYVSPRVASALVGSMRGEGDAAASGSELEHLTAREREVFQLVALGRANKEIATALHLSLATVKKHRENLQRKLDVHSAAEIARMAIREGLLSP